VTARTALVALLAALVALALASGAAAAREPTQTFPVRIFVSEKFPAFHGKLHSGSDFCAARRPVRVYRARPGEDELLGRGRSEGDGAWKVPIGEKLTSGAFYAEAPAFGSAALGIVCPPARSKLVTVD
jgi:hypothetical protein